MGAELHKIQHKSIQVVAEGVGLENYLIRNIVALCNFQCNVCLWKIKTLCRDALLNFYQDKLDPAEHTKEHWWQGKKSWTSQICKKATFFLLKYVPGGFITGKKKSSTKNRFVVDRFVFNHLALDNTSQTADNKHASSMIFPFFLLASKTEKPLGDDTFQNQTVKLIC